MVSLLSSVSLVAIFFFGNIVQNKKHEKIHKWFRIRWTAISESLWLTLPETAISWILNFNTKAAIVLRYAWIKPGRTVTFSFFAISCLPGIYFVFVDQGYVFAGILMVCLISSAFLNAFEKEPKSTYLLFVNTVIFFSSAIYLATRLIFGVLAIDIFSSLLITIVSIPVLSILFRAPLIVLAFLHISEKKRLLLTVVTTSQEAC